MFRKSEEEKRMDILKTISTLIRISKTDAVYRDIYLNRSRELISGIMPPEEYLNLIGKRKWLSQLPHKIHIAIEKDDWSTVEELSKRISKLKKWEEENLVLFDIGEEIYENDEIMIDPFTPGFNHLIGIPSEDLLLLRDNIVKMLSELQKDDRSYREFYSTRSDAFKKISLSKLRKGDSAIAVLDEIDLKEKAEQALNTGDMELLKQMAELQLKQTAPRGAGSGQDSSTEDTSDAGSTLTTQFSELTLSNAERLGLTFVHLDESMDYKTLFRHAFHPVFEKESETAWEKMEKFSKNLSDQLKKHIELYALHTFLNSGGSRYLSDFAAEDCLVELFPELSEDIDNNSELISELGLKNRRGLSRKQIEHALLQNGPRVLKDILDLEPESYRIVCIPPDMYLRLGEAQGWGKKEIWTHFDGYHTWKKGKFMALAGGDVRFGGIYDLVGIGREYTSDHIVTRFAVIKRNRMVSW